MSQSMILVHPVAKRPKSNRFTETTLPGNEVSRNITDLIMYMHCYNFGMSLSTCTCT